MFGDCQIILGLQKVGAVTTWLNLDNFCLTQLNVSKKMLFQTRGKLSTGIVLG